MKEITIKFTNNKAAILEYFLRKRYKVNGKRSLERLVKLAVLDIQAQVAKEDLELIENNMKLRKE